MFEIVLNDYILNSCAPFCPPINTLLFSTRAHRSSYKTLPLPSRLPTASYFPISLSLLTLTPWTRHVYRIQNLASRQVLILYFSWFFHLMVQTATDSTNIFYVCLFELRRTADSDVVQTPQFCMAQVEYSGTAVNKRKLKILFRIVNIF